jgi:RNA polymerase sigma-70 factor (ECF subfamily)
VAGDALDDATQEVFLVAHRRFNDYQARSSLLTWLCGIAVHIARDFRRLRRHQAIYCEFESEKWPGFEQDPTARLEQAEQHRIIVRALERLTERQREVLVLMDLRHLSASETAKMVQCNTNTVYMRLKAARRAFAVAVGLTASP